MRVTVITMQTATHEHKSGSTGICQCCRSLIESIDSVKGPYDIGPYKTVCEKCWSNPILHFPDKYIEKNGLSYAPKPSQEDRVQNAHLRIWNGELDKQNIRVLLVEPNYYTRFPPLGLLKLSGFHKTRGDSVKLVRFPENPHIEPDIIYVTSLFTYSWREVHEAVRYYKELFPQVKLVLGGIYASLLPDHAMSSGADCIHIGLFQKVEDYEPDYSIINDSGWDSNVLFSSRGCIRGCGFCAVPKLEGGISYKKTILNLLNDKFMKIVLWDNNILATPNWRDIFDELEELGYEVDFNQGFDARLITPEVAERISRLKTKMIRLAFDNSRDHYAINRAISFLSEAGVRRRKIVVYTLFNYSDTPDDFFSRVRQLLRWGVVSYPMRFEPLCVLAKNKFISPQWDKQRLNTIQHARRVIGYAGAFPPYPGLIRKLNKAKGFDDGFALRPSIQEIRRRLKGLDETEIKLVYAYYQKYDLTTAKLPIRTALRRTKEEKEELDWILNKRKRNKEQKRLRGSLDWRSQFSDKEIQARSHD